MEFNVSIDNIVIGAGVGGAIVAMTVIMSAIARALSSYGRRRVLRMFGANLNIDLEHYHETVEELETIIRTRQEHPRVLLSHAIEDREFARRLATDLRAQGIEVWLPEEGLRVGDDIMATVKSEISESQWLINVITPASVESLWVRKEVSEALKAEQDRGRPFVIPILLKGSVPDKMSARLYADFRTDYDEGLSKLVSSLKRATADTEPESAI